MLLLVQLNCTNVCRWYREKGHKASLREWNGMEETVSSIDFSSWRVLISFCAQRCLLCRIFISMKDETYLGECWKDHCSVTCISQIAFSVLYLLASGSCSSDCCYLLQQIRTVWNTVVYGMTVHCGWFLLLISKDDLCLFASLIDLRAPTSKC